MTVTLPSGTPSSPRQAPAAVLGVHDDRVDAAVERPLGRALAGPRLARQDVVGREDERAREGAQQDRVERLHGQPLEVHDVRAARAAARAAASMSGAWRASFAACRARPAAGTPR